MGRPLGRARVSEQRRRAREGSAEGATSAGRWDGAEKPRAGPRGPRVSPGAPHLHGRGGTSDRRGAPGTRRAAAASRLPAPRLRLRSVRSGFPRRRRGGRLEEEPRRGAEEAEGRRGSLAGRVAARQFQALGSGPCAGGTEAGGEGGPSREGHPLARLDDAPLAWLWAAPSGAQGTLLRCSGRSPTRRLAAEGIRLRGARALL